MSRWLSRPVSVLLLAGLLGVATVASYAPVFSAGFVDIDDADYVPENETVKAGLRIDGVAWAFTGAHAGNWFPLTWLSHMADVELFGLDPAGHHAMNLALHVANALLLFALLVSLTGSIAPSLLVAGVFALHPVNVESVAWISQRKSTLATLFGILAIGGYVRWTRSGSRVAYAASLVAFALSLLSKQSFVPLPFALVLLDYWPLQRRDWLRRWPEKIPYGLLAIAASIAALLAQGDAMATGATYPLAIRLGNAVISCVRYVETLLWPTSLAVFHPIYEDEITPLRVAVCALLLVAVTAAAFGFGRRRRWLVVGWLWFLGLLMPVIGLVQVGAQSMADRYAYVPSWGLALMLGWTAWDFARPRRAARVAFVASTCLLLAVLAVATHRQARHWHDSIALFEAAVAADDRNYVAHRALAGQYFNRGDYARALRHAEAGLRHPRDPGEILPIYGMALYQTGGKQAAIERLVEATRVAPRNVMGFTNLGWVYLQEGRFDLAAETLTAALAVDPQSARAAALLATSQFRLGRFDAAATNSERAVALDPTNFDARIEWARALARLDRVDDTTRVLADAIDAARAAPVAQRDRLLSTLHLYRGDAFALQGQAAPAIADYEASLAAWPDNFAATNNLASLLATGTDPARAVTLAERAVALARRPEAFLTLASAYDATERRDDAIRAARDALALARETGNASAEAAAQAQLEVWGIAQDP